MGVETLRLKGGFRRKIHNEVKADMEEQRENVLMISSVSLLVKSVTRRSLPHLYAIFWVKPLVCWAESVSPLTMKSVDDSNQMSPPMWKPDVKGQSSSLPVRYIRVPAE